MQILCRISLLKRQATTQKKLNEITDRLDVLYEDGRIPSYVAAVAKDGKVFFSAVRGDTAIGSGEEVSLETMYYLASMTKPICFDRNISIN